MEKIVQCLLYMMDSTTTQLLNNFKSFLWLTKQNSALLKFSCCEDMMQLEREKYSGCLISEHSR